MKQRKLHRRTLPLIEQRCIGNIFSTIDVATRRAVETSFRMRKWNDSVISFVFSQHDTHYVTVVTSFLLFSSSFPLPFSSSFSYLLILVLLFFILFSLISSCSPFPFPFSSSSLPFSLPFSYFLYSFELYIHFISLLFFP